MACASEAAIRLDAQEVMSQEIAKGNALVSARFVPSLQRKPQIQKLDAAKYIGGDTTPLRRWYNELSEAIEAYEITDPHTQVSFAITTLTGRARSWTVGCRVADATVFPTLDSLKPMPEITFEPPQNAY